MARHPLIFHPSPVTRHPLIHHLEGEALGLHRVRRAAEGVSENDGFAIAVQTIQTNQPAGFVVYIDQTIRLSAIEFPLVSIGCSSDAHRMLIGCSSGAHREHTMTSP